MFALTDTPSMKLITFEVDDCLRYTIVVPMSIYTEGVSMILSRLTSNDPADECAIASKVSAYNFWSTKKGATTYMGINAFITLHRLVTSICNFCFPFFYTRIDHNGTTFSSRMRCRIQLFSAMIRWSTGTMRKARRMVS